MDRSPLAGSISRRDALVVGGVTAAAAWVTPSVVGLDRAAAADPSNGYSVVYTEDFQGAIGQPGVASWSTTQTANPTGGELILGRFTNTTVTLRVNLPPHDCVRICFDLYVNDSWDGTNPTWGGPDQFGFRIDGTTIWDEPYNSNNAPAGGTIITGPARLWFTNRWFDRVIRYCVESDHTAGTVQFEFFGSGLQSVNDESWGLDNVEVSAG